jgi:hypothetical protein
MELNLEWVNLEGASGFDESFFVTGFLFNKVGFIIFWGLVAFVEIIEFIILYWFVIYIL